MQAYVLSHDPSRSQQSPTWSPRNQGTATQAAAKASMVGALRLVTSTMRRHVLEELYRYAIVGGWTAEGWRLQ